MIVEFIGCTGSGKTTLITRIQSRLADTECVFTAQTIAASRIGLGGVTNPTIQNLVQELVVFPYFVRSLRRQRAFIALTIRLFTRNAGLSWVTIHNLRSIERKIGAYEMTRRHDRDAIILVDEGPIQAAHMFAFTTTPPTREEMTTFAGLLPVPDLVVYVQSPVEALVKRTLQRPDPPRQISSKSRVSVEGCVRSAVALFEELVHSRNLRDRSLIVANPDRSSPEYDDLVEEIVGFILDRRMAAMRPRYPNVMPAST